MAVFFVEKLRLPFTFQYILLSMPDWLHMAAPFYFMGNFSIFEQK
jgi:hypothetical protein